MNRYEYPKYKKPVTTWPFEVGQRVKTANEGSSYQEHGRIAFVNDMGEVWVFWDGETVQSGPVDRTYLLHE